jgi:hypothetical protein
MREAYAAICKYKRQVFPVHNTELNDIINVLEGHGLVRITNKKDGKILDLVVLPDVVERGVSNSPLLVEVLADGLKAIDKIK